jgi:hypothetical protein
MSSVHPIKRDIPNIIRRTGHRLKFPEYFAALDAALAGLIPKMSRAAS